MSTEINSDQAEYWRSASQWVDYQDQLDALLQPVLDRLLQDAALAPGEQILDIGCGTGASTMAAAREVGTAGHVTGADISDILLDLATKRTQDAGLENVTYVSGDAQTYEFDSKRYHKVMSRFGVMFFDDPVAAFANILRASVPGGQLLFLSWAALAANPWFAIPAKAAFDVVGRPPPPDPRAPGPLAFAEGDYVRDILQSAGWVDIDVSEVGVDLTPMGTVDDIARFASRVGPVSRIITDQGGSEADAHKVETLVAERISQFDTDLGVRIPARLNLVRAAAAAE